MYISDIIRDHGFANRRWRTAGSAGLDPKTRRPVTGGSSRYPEHKEPMWGWVKTSLNLWVNHILGGMNLNILNEHMGFIKAI